MVTALDTLESNNRYGITVAIHPSQLNKGFNTLNAAGLYDALVNQADPTSNTVTPIKSMLLNTTPLTWGMSIKLCTPLYTHKKEALALQTDHHQRPSFMYHLVDANVDQVHQVIVKMNESQSHYSVVRGNKELDIIQSRLKNEWVVRQSAKIKGLEYKLDKKSIGIEDVVFRLATVLVGSDIKAVIVEAECRDASHHSPLQSILDRICSAWLSLDFSYCPTVQEYQQAHLSSTQFSSLHRAFHLVKALRGANVL